MKVLSLAVVGLVIALDAQAHAATKSFDFNGPGVSGSLVLTYGASTDAKYPDAYEVTGIAGTVSDLNVGIVDAAVGSLLPINHAMPEAENLLAPDDFSKVAVASGLPDENHGSLSYDNLLWPGGSPQTASDYPFHSGFLDIYGLMFEIGDGRFANFWSNGIVPGGTTPNYGFAVATADSALDYVGGVAVSPVPVPGSLGLIAGGLLGLTIVRRRAATA